MLREKYSLVHQLLSSIICAMFPADVVEAGAHIIMFIISWMAGDSAQGGTTSTGE